MFAVDLGARECTLNPSATALRELRVAIVEAPRTTSHVWLIARLSKGFSPHYDPLRKKEPFDGAGSRWYASPQC